MLHARTVLLALLKAESRIRIIMVNRSHVKQRAEMVSNNEWFEKLI